MYYNPNAPTTTNLNFLKLPRLVIMNLKLCHKPLQTCILWRTLLFVTNNINQTIREVSTEYIFLKLIFGWAWLWRRPSCYIHFRQSAGPVSPSIILVGCKLDLVEVGCRREVTLEEARCKADSLGTMYTGRYWFDFKFAIRMWILQMLR